MEARGTHHRRKKSSVWVGTLLTGRPPASSHIRAWPVSLLEQPFSFIIHFRPAESNNELSKGHETVQTRKGLSLSRNMEERTSIHIQEQKQKYLTPHPSLGGKIAKISPTHAVSIIRDNVKLRQWINLQSLLYQGHRSPTIQQNFVFKANKLSKVMPGIPFIAP